jgi:excisionase family DNA binding protein
MNSRHLIGVREAARRLNVHENTVRNWIDRGWLGAYRLPSGVRRLDPVEVANLIGNPRPTRGMVVEGDVLP